MILASGLLVLTFLAAGLEWYAVAKGNRRLEFFAKPAVMIVLFAYLAAATGLRGAPLWFGIGLFFSLVGDMSLLISPRLFVPGLIAFLLVHVCYIIGFSLDVAALNVTWAGLMTLVLAMGAVRVIRRLAVGLYQKGLKRMVWPVRLYTMAISAMLLVAILTLSRLEWNAWAALLVSAGAALFYFSDLVLAWNKFINPIKDGRLINMVMYHLGQIALTVGVVLHFSG